MTAQEVDKLIQGVYDTIFLSATTAEPGGKPLNTSSRTMLTLMKPGIAVRGKDFANPWTPGNNTGSQEAAINTARLSDIIPRTNGLHENSGNEISKVYSDILTGVSIPQQPPNPIIDAQLDAAYNFLYRIIIPIDSETGASLPPETKVTPIYQAYLENQSYYAAQRSAYYAAYTEAQNTPQGKNTWPLIAPSLQIPVKQAWDKWRSNKADLVEQNLAIMTTSSQNSLLKAFKKAQDLFEGYGVALEEGGALAPMIRRVSLLPSNWYSSNDNTGWATVKVSAGSSFSQSSADYKSFGASAGFSLGIFSIGAKAGGSWSSNHFSSETQNLSFEFSWKRVEVIRPWMSFHLLSTPGWNLGNMYPKKGGISNGTKNQLGLPGPAWPLMTTSFIIVKGVKIRATWAKADWDKMQKELSLGANVGIGPFSIGGSYAQSHTNETWSSAFANGTITVPGVQIIGGLNAVVPFSAPVDMPV